VLCRSWWPMEMSGYDTVGSRRCRSSGGEGCRVSISLVRTIRQLDEIAWVDLTSMWANEIGVAGKLRERCSLRFAPNRQRHTRNGRGGVVMREVQCMSPTSVTVPVDSERCGRATCSERVGERVGTAWSSSACHGGHAEVRTGEQRTV